MEKLHSTGRRGVKEQILKLREEKYSYRDIQKKLNCSKSTISFHCNNEGTQDIGLREDVITDDTKKEIYEYSKTHTNNEGVKHFGVSKMSIKRYKKKIYNTTATNKEWSEDEINRLIELRKTNRWRETLIILNNEFGNSRTENGASKRLKKLEKIS